MAEAGSTREITLTRIYDAPRDLVFRAWTEAEQLARWWGPDEFAVAMAESDPRAGGALLIVMRAQDGTELPMRGVYEEVVAPERIIVTSKIPGPGDVPIGESVHTVTFADLGGRTEIVVRARAVVYGSEGMGALAGMHAGWSQSLQCLDDVLTGAVDRQVLITRMYEAPPEQVFELWIEPEHVMKWWGPDGFTITIDEMDVRPGGRWKFTMHGPDGTDYPNTVLYDEITPPKRLVYTHGEPGDPDPQFTSTVTFEEMMANTVLSMRLVFDSAASRDMVVEKYHAIEGGNQTLARLGGLIASQTARERES